MLRPNGLIAIADPDGYSKFNQKHILDNPEMSVANFLNAMSIDKLLTDLGFEVLTNKIQIDYEGTLTEVKVNCSDKNSKPITDNNVQIDLNLGYITIAKRPSTK